MARDRAFKIGSVGDVNPVDYGGGYVFYNLAQRDFYLEYTYGLEDGREHGEEHKPVEVYQIDLERTAAQFVRDHDWVDWGNVASSTGQPVDTYTNLDKLADPNYRAWVIYDAASHYGWHEFDSYPIRMSPSALEKRWAGKMHKWPGDFAPKTQATLFPSRDS